MKKIFIAIAIMLASAQAETSPFVRVDMDYTFGRYVWTGINVSTDKMNFVHDIVYYEESQIVQTDVGTFGSFGKVDVVALIGVLHNVRGKVLDYVMPQLYLYSTLGKVSLEGWNLYTQGIDNTDERLIDFRYFALYSAMPFLEIGPHVETNLDVSTDAPQLMNTLCAGGAVRIPYGKDDSFLVFLGSDIEDEYHFVSRYTFLFNF